MKIIDIHTHILPGVDDGAWDLLDAVLMAELAVEGGTTALIATPHAGAPSPNLRRRAGIDQMTEKRRFDDLKSALKEREIPLALYLGAEWHCTGDVGAQIRRKEARAMPDGRHYLLEFDFHADAEACARQIQAAQNAGAAVIVAHPERYECVRADVRIAERWADLGCALQVNADGLIGKTDILTARILRRLFDRDLVTYVASDAHDPYERTPYLGDAFDVLCGLKSRQYAETIFFENPAKLLVESVVART